MDSEKVEQLSPVNSKSITITRQLWEYFYGNQPDFILAFRRVFRSKWIILDVLILI